MSVTIKDVASKAGVSIATVSRYFSSREKLKESTAVRVQRAIDELEFVPNNNARILKAGKSYIVGLVVPDITISFFYNVVKALNDIFYSNGYFLMICDSEYKPDRERHHIDSLLKLNADLLLVATVGSNVEYLSSVANRYNKLVLFDRFEPEVNVDSFCYDHRNISKDLTDIVIKKYPHDFVILMGPPFSPVTRERLAGMMDSFRENGIEKSQVEVIDGILSSEQAEAALNKVIEKRSYPKTIIFSNENCLEGLARAVWRSTVKVNEELFIAGFTTDALSNLCNIKGICAIQEEYKIGLALGDFCLKKLKAPKKASAVTKKFISSFIVSED